MIYKTDYDVAFLTVFELAKYLCNHKNKEIGFTSDTATEVLVNDVEPSEWHGVVVTDMFDSNVIAFGYYGTGIDTIYNPVFDEYIYEEFKENGVVLAIIDYFKKEFNMDIDSRYKICICTKDLED